MERLTQRDEFGNADIIALSEIMPEIYAKLSFSETNALTAALNRLAEYEGTGLTPEEVDELQQRNSDYRDTINFLRERETEMEEAFNDRYWD